MSRRLAALFLALFLPLVMLPGAACASGDPSPPLTGTSSTEAPAKALEAAYAAAIDRAADRGPEDIVTDLFSLAPWNPELVRDDRGRVLMITFDATAPWRLRRPGEVVLLEADLWLTAVPEVERRCRRWGLEGSALTLRLAQLLGLPPDWPGDGFVAVWARPSTLVRPCPDPEVWDRECGLFVPALEASQAGSGGGGSAAVGEGRPVLPGPCSSFAGSGASSAVPSSPAAADAHLRWICATWEASHGTAVEVEERFPWTALGWTWDWGPSRSPRGVSEYVARAGTRVVFSGVLSSEEVCTP